MDISSINDGKDYIENETAVSLFGRIEETSEWPEIEDANELKTLGEEILKSNIELSVTLTVKAVDLHLLNVNTERIKLGDWVRVISLPHNLDKKFQCTKIVYDILNPDQNEYVFGLSFTSLTEKQVNGEKTTMSIMASVNDRIGDAESRIDGSAVLDNYGKVLPQQSCSRIVRKNSSFTLTNDEAGCFVLCNCTSDNGDIIITISDTTDIPVGGEVEIIRWGGDTALTIREGTGISICSVNKKVLVTGDRNVAYPYGVVTLKRIDLTTWLLVGALA